MIKVGLLAKAAVVILGLYVFVNPVQRIMDRSHSDDQVAFGIFPAGDNWEYFGGAVQTLFEGHHNGFVQDRTLANLYMTVTIALSGGNVAYALILQALILGLCAFLVARAVMPQLGWPAALLLVFMLYRLGKFYTPYFATETYGFTLTCLAFALLWVSIFQKSYAHFAVGLAVYSLAQTARVGAIFSLVCVIIWGIFYFKLHIAWTTKIKQVTILLGCLIFGNAMNLLCRKLYLGDASVGQGNGIYNVYSLVRGQQGWTSHYGDNVSDVTWELILKEVISHPENLLKGIVIRTYAYFEKLLEYILRSFFLEEPFFLLIIAMAALLGFTLYRYRRFAWAQFIFAFFIGQLLSAPVLGTVAFYRVFSTSAPFVFAFAVIAFCFVFRRFKNPVNENSSDRPFKSRAILIAGLLVCFAPIFGPPLVHLFYNDTKEIPRSSVTFREMDMNQPVSLVVHLSPDMPAVRILDDGKGERFTMTEQEFRKSGERLHKEEGFKIFEVPNTPFTLALAMAINHPDKTLIYLVKDEELLKEKRIAKVTGKMKKYEKRYVLFVESVETVKAL